MALGELKNGIGPDAYAIYQQVLAAVVERDHPVGSLYISENPTSPAELYGGTWERVEDCTIWGASSLHPAGTKLEAGLPNITGNVSGLYGEISDALAKGALYAISGSTKANSDPWENIFGQLGFDASRSNSIYGRSDTVQPPAYCMYIWRRVA